MNTFIIIYEIKEIDFQFIIHQISNESIINLLKASTDLEKSSSKIRVLKLHKKDVEKILDELGNLFIFKGLKDNETPNELGYYIEKLIDIFNRKLYEK